MFCGGGGESTGLIEAAHDYNFDVNMSAINHWERAKEYCCLSWNLWNIKVYEV